MVSKQAVIGGRRVYFSLSGEILELQKGGKLMERIERSVEQGEVKNVELFVFTDNLVFQSVFYKVTLKIPLLF